jgi:hypothetical protein
MIKEVAKTAIADCLLYFNDAIDSYIRFLIPIYKFKKKIFSIVLKLHFSLIQFYVLLRHIDCFHLRLQENRNEKLSLVIDILFIHSSN